MAGLIRVQNRQCGVYPVGFVEPNPGVSFIFCNGIENGAEDAQESGQAISEALTSQRVTVFHNPTTFGNYKDRSDEQLRMQSAISKQFAELIRQEIHRHRHADIADREIRIILFVHSHGAVVARRALDRLTVPERNRVEVFAFGGATMIPNNRARVARNYIRESDLIARAGNVRDHRNVFYDISRVHKIQKTGKNLEQSILETAGSDLQMHLNPVFNTYRDNFQEICQRYERIFERGDHDALLADPYFVQQRNRYQQLFRDYNVYVLDEIPFPEPNYTPIRRHANFSEFIGNLGWNMLAVAANTVEAAVCASVHVKKNHTFEEYLPQVRAVAEELEVN